MIYNIVKVMKPKIGDIIEVIWRDTHTPILCTWMDKNEYDNWCKNGLIVQSVGVYLGENNKDVRLVGDIDRSDDTNGEIVCRPINISKGVITKLTILKRSDNGLEKTKKSRK